MKIVSELTESLFGGSVEYKEEDIIKFKNNILGFDNLTEYIVLGEISNDSALCFLQSIQNPIVSFVVTDPFKFVKDYDFVLDEKSKNLIEVDAVEDIRVLVIVNILDNIKESTMNLKAPIIINMKNMKAVQTIIDEEYPIKYKFLDNTKKE